MIKIYKLINPIDNVIRYIGITSKTLQKRLKSHINDKKSNIHKINWINKLKSNDLFPIIELIEEVDDIKIANVRERYWINYYRNIGCNLLNYTDGGEGCKGYKWSIEMRKNKSESMCGDKNYFYGKSHSEETKNIMKITAAKFKDKNGMYNKKHNETSKQKMSKSMIGKFVGDKNPRALRLYQYDLKLNLINVWNCCKDFSNFYNISHSNTCNSAKNNNNKESNYHIILNKKYVIQYDLNNNIIKHYNNATEASKETGIILSSICKCCKGRNKTTGNFIFKYEIHDGFILKYK